MSKIIFHYSFHLEVLSTGAVKSSKNKWPSWNQKNLETPVSDYTVTFLETIISKGHKNCIIYPHCKIWVWRF